MEAKNRRLPEWLIRVRTGQLMLPRFQRYESWSHGEVVTLLDSVLRGRPVGAALVLAIGNTEPFVSRRMAGATDSNRTDNGAPTRWAAAPDGALEGAQRRVREPELLCVFDSRPRRYLPSKKPQPVDEEWPTLPCMGRSAEGATEPQFGTHASSTP